jgi:tRNA(Ile2) C34 agmatinyltransferase TiaS
MGQFQPLATTPSLWDVQVERPLCPQCKMRMMRTQQDFHANFECLRCGHTRPAYVEEDF